MGKGKMEGGVKKGSLEEGPVWLDACSQSERATQRLLFREHSSDKSRGKRVQCALGGTGEDTNLSLDIVLRIYSLYSELLFKALPSPSPFPMSLAPAGKGDSPKIATNSRPGWTLHPGPDLWLPQAPVLSPLWLGASALPSRPSPHCRGTLTEPGR